MNAVARFLRPTALGLLLLVLGLLVQAGVFSMTSMTCSYEHGGMVESTWTLGPGGMVSIVTGAGGTRVAVRWGLLALDLLLTYVLAAYLARALARVTGLRRPGPAYGLVVAASVALAFLVSIAMSRAYWGYFLERPPVPRAMGDIARVASVTPVLTAAAAGGAPALAIREDFSLTNALASGRNDPYYCLEERLLIDLDRRGLLPAVHSVALPPDLPDLLPLIRSTGLLAAPEAGYEEEAARLGGVIIDAVDGAGRRLVVMGLGGGQVENDHYPYYEMVFSEASGAPGLAYAGGHRFFYDVAGIEGAEWYVAWPLLCLPLVPAGLVVFTIACMLRRRRALPSDSHGDGS